MFYRSDQPTSILAVWYCTISAAVLIRAAGNKKIKRILTDIPTTGTDSNILNFVFLLISCTRTARLQLTASDRSAPALSTFPECSLHNSNTIEAFRAFVSARRPRLQAKFALLDVQFNAHIDNAFGLENLNSLSTNPPHSTALRKVIIRASSQSICSTSTEYTNVLCAVRTRNHVMTRILLSLWPR